MNRDKFSILDKC